MAMKRTFFAANSDSSTAEQAESQIEAFTIIIPAIAGIMLKSQIQLFSVQFSS